MKNYFTFNRAYLVWTVGLFCVEVLIALFVHDKIIRPYIGDFLVVILIYCFFRTFLLFSVLQLALLSLVIAYVVEGLQYLRIVQVMGLQDSKLARIIIGNSFEWLDMLAYTTGILVVLGIEKVVRTKIS